MGFRAIHGRLQVHSWWIGLLAILLGGGSIAYTSSRPSMPQPTPQAPSACAKGNYPVYHPSRLQIVQSCLAISGTVVFVAHEADGDWHIALSPDPLYRDYVTVQNAETHGANWVLEIVPACATPPADSTAAAKCPANPEPVPRMGQHITATGPYVLDLQHGGHAELHPLLLPLNHVAPRCLGSLIRR